MERIIILALILLPFIGFCQENRKEFKTTTNEYEELLAKNDTMPLYAMNPISVTAPRIFKNKRDERKYWRLVRDVKKVYPYAKLTAEKLDYYRIDLVGIDNQSKRRRIMKKVEKELIDEYGKEVKKLTVNQGHLLLKLIDRETGSTSYEVIKGLRGNFSASVWQGVAVVFSKSLKVEYNPKGEDKEVEEIINKINSGVL